MTARLEFAVKDMHCASCGLLVDDLVEDIPGVARSTTDVRSGRTVVELTAPATGLPGAEADVAELTRAVIAAIAEAGHRATPLT